MEQAPPPGPAARRGPKPKANGQDNVVDAEFQEVKDNKNKVASGE